jgi:hypothetical protein
MKKAEVSSTGGKIVYSSTGLVHIPATGAYSGRAAEEGIEVRVYDAPKRGRGRPRLDSVAKYDFSAFMPNVKVPEWKGESRVYVRLTDD